MNAKTYAQRREETLNKIHNELQSDDRVLAAWLTGSYGRGDQDDFSDLDICVVIANESLEVIENWNDFVALAGKRANAHEARQNAPQGGTMASVLYEDGVTIDWLLIPQDIATRPSESRLLFEKKLIPLEKEGPKPSQDELQKTLDDRISYFWMMAAVAAKSILRDHGVRFHVFLNMLFWTSEEIADLVAMEKRPYLRFSGLILSTTQKQQSETLIGLCQKVMGLTKGDHKQAFAVIKNLVSLRTNNFGN